MSSVPSTIAGSPLQLVCSGNTVLSANIIGVTVFTPLASQSLSTGGINASSLAATGNLNANNLTVNLVGVDTILGNQMSIGIISASRANISSINALQSNSVSAGFGSFYSNTAQVGPLTASSVTANVVSPALLTPPNSFSSNNVSSVVMPLLGDIGELTVRLCGLGNSSFNVRMAASTGSASSFDTAAGSYKSALMSIASGGTQSSVPQAAAYPTLAYACQGSLNTQCFSIKYSKPVPTGGAGGSTFEVVATGTADQTASGGGYPAYRNYGTVVHNPAPDAPATYLRLSIEDAAANCYIMASSQPRSFF